MGQRLVQEVGRGALRQLDGLPTTLLCQFEEQPPVPTGSSHAGRRGDGAVLAALEEKMRRSIDTWGSVLRMLQDWEAELITPQFRYEQAQAYIQRRYEQDLRNHIIRFKRQCPGGSFAHWMATEQFPFHDNVDEYGSWQRGNLSAGGTHGWQEFVDMFDGTSAGEALLDARMDTLAMDHVQSADADAWWHLFKRGEIYEMQPLNDQEAALSALRCGK